MSSFTRSRYAGKTKKLYLLLVILFLTAETFPQWLVTNAPKGIPIYSFTSSGENVFAGGDNDAFVDIGGCVFFSTNNGADWTDVSSSLNCPEIRALAVIGTYVFAGSHGSGIFRSTNNGTSWSSFSTGLSNNSVLALAVIGTNLFAGTLNGVFLSTDNGSAWTEAGMTGSSVWYLAASGTYIFAGADDGVFLSTNNGTNWTRTSFNASYVQSLAVSGENIFAAADLKLFHSNDNGESWTNVTNGLSNLPVYALAISRGNVFALTNWGNIFHSSNNGTNWTLVNEGIIDTLVLAIGINDNYLFACGAGEGLWRRPLSDMITAAESSFELPKRFALYQNYPNPFNPSTSIQYAVGSMQFVTLRIYDVLGNEIVTLVNEEKPAGSYEVTWNAEGLPSGVYFYQLHAGNFVGSKKMILLR